MTILGEIIDKLPTVKEQHARDSRIYNDLKAEARREVENLFSSLEVKPIEFPPFGTLVFPYHKMGAIDSLNLFDLDELIIFSFYWQNRKRYKKVADIGSNIGLHSILLSKCGYDVRCYEPDPETFKVLQRNLKLNNCSSVAPFNAAVSSKPGEMEFIRVLGNITGSHLAGSKADPYGEMVKFPVKVEGIGPIIEWADFIKLDAEGHEKEIVLATDREQWKKTDAMIEVENKDNAAALFAHFTNLGINMFAQKINWRKVNKIDDMPAGYKNGSLFVSSKKEMPW
jgi:FkbM family methyltransferase